MWLNNKHILVASFPVYTQVYKLVQKLHMTFRHVDALRVRPKMDSLSSGYSSETFLSDLMDDLNEILCKSQNLSQRMDKMEKILFYSSSPSPSGEHTHRVDLIGKQMQIKGLGKHKWGAQISIVLKR